jgi:hypothetical protein
MKLANGIQLTDGSILDEAFSELKEKVKSLSGVSSTGVTDNTYIDSKIEEVKALIPVVDLSGYAKTTDIAEVVNSLNSLIEELKAGKYNVSVANTTTTV